MYLDEKLTDAQIAERLGNVATVKRVRSWRHRFGIKTLGRAERNDVPPIEGRLRSLLVGSMLGDGRLVRRPNATHYQENHEVSQKDYLLWKVSIWGAWAKSGVKPVNWKKEGQTYPGFRFHTCGHPSLNPWQEMFYDSHHRGWKRLVPEVVDLVDEFALAVWYMDDGTTSWWPDITFGMDTKSRHVAWSIFEKFGLCPEWEPRVGKTGHFHFGRNHEETAHRFIDLVSPHIPECMGHKLVFGFNTGRNNIVRGKLDRETLERMASANVPIRQMAKLLGVGASTVSRHLERHGINHQRKVGRPAI